MSEEEKKAYFDLIDRVSPDEVLSNLPNKKISNYKSIMFYIISNLSDMYKEYLAFGDDDSTRELLSEIEEKIKICMDYYGYSFNRRAPFVNDVIFSITSGNNSYFDNDLKDVPADRHLRRVFEYLLYGIDDSDKTKVVHYNSNNRDLAGCAKYKDFQTRLYTRVIEDNIVCVFGVFLKKDDDDVHLNKVAGKRLKSVNKELDVLKVQLKNPEDRERILSENNERLNIFLDKIGFEYRTIEEEFDIEKVDNFLMSELASDYSLMPDKAQDNFDYYVYCALEILEDKGFVDLNDERARKINLGAWLDRQIKDIALYKLSDERKNDIIMLISSKKSRLISNGNESNHYPLSNVIGLNSEDIDHSNGVFVHSTISDYYFRSVASSKWIDFYIVARSIFKDKGFVDLEDERAKEINLGKWLDLQIELLSKGMLDETKKEYIELLISNMDSRKDKVIVPELLEHGKKIDLSRSTTSRIRNSVAVLSLDDLRKLDETVNEINSKNR